MIKSDKNIFSFPVSSDLFVPFFAGRALHEVRALQDGVLPHPVFDADDRLLQFRRMATPSVVAPGHLCPIRSGFMLDP